MKKVTLQNSDGKVHEDSVTNLAMLARLHGLDESNLMFWIFEFGEEEGLMRAMDEMLDRLSFENESAASEVPWKETFFRIREFKGCMAGLPWKNGIWVCKGEARGG